MLTLGALWGSAGGVHAASGAPAAGVAGLRTERAWAAAGGFAAAGDGIAIPSPAAVAGRVVIVHLDEESVPAAENPGAPALGGDASGSNPGPSADWERVPAASTPPAAGNSASAAPNGASQSATGASSAGASASDGASARSAATPAGTQPQSRPAAPVATVASAQRASATDASNGAGAVMTGMATGVAGGGGEQRADLGPPPALDLSAIQSGPDLSSISLDGEFKQADTPARAAALRVTEQARVELAAGNVDAALRELSHAVSIDPGNPFEYFYLGRAYIARGNYAQALTFFERAEIGFAARPDWLGETVGFEGACDEELGQMSNAALAYRRALGSAPNNLRARVGYSRLAGYLPGTATADASAPTGTASGEAPPPPERSAAGPAPAEAPPPPPPAPAAPADDWQKSPSAADQPD